MKDSSEPITLLGIPFVLSGLYLAIGQAETVVGFINLYQHLGDKLSLSRAVQCWEFIKKHLIDYENGEWYWSLSSDGAVNREDDKVGFWKCPYHNGRMCMEIMERF